MKVIIVASLAFSLTNFRGTLIKDIVAAGNEVLACAPDGDDGVISDLTALGARFRAIPLDRASLNPIEDFTTLRALIRLFREEKPDIILAYTQKPIIYAGLAHRITRRGRFYPMVTGLGYAFSGARRTRLLRRIVATLYRLSLARSSKVIVFNRNDHDEMRQHAIVGKKHEVVIVPGSGVDMSRYERQPLPQGEMVFLLIARLLRDKGLSEYFQAAELVKRQHPNVRFQLLGPFDLNPAAISQVELTNWQSKGVIDYLGETRDVRPFLAACTVFVLPSYREGMPRAVLEAMATGRAIITTQAPGCRETVTEGENGFLVPVADGRALADAIMRFCRDPELAAAMGARSHLMAQQRFDVNLVNQLLLATLGIMPG